MRLFAAPWRRNPVEEGADDGLDSLVRRLQEVAEAHDAPAEHVAAARSRMRLALARARARQPAAAARRWRARRPLAAAAAVAVVLVAGGAISMLLGGPGGPGGLIGSQTAEAVVLTGTLEVQGGDFTLLTDAGPQQISLGPQALVVDAVGNPVPVDSLTRGQQLSVKAKRDDKDRLVVDEIQAKSEVRGRITALSAGQLQLTGERTTITVLITAATEVKGALAIGQLVEVEVERNAAGDLVAREIEAEDDGRDKPEFGLPPTPAAAPALSPTQAKRDDGERESASPRPTAPPPTPAPGKTAAPSPSNTPERERETESDGYQPAPQPASAPAPQPTASGGSGGGSGTHDGDDGEHDGEHDH
jgi:hypothetical protein